MFDYEPIINVRALVETEELERLVESELKYHKTMVQVLTTRLENIRGVG